MPTEKDIQFGALKIFAAVAEANTLTQAAQKLGISQSAVSQAINQLEQTTGAQLIVRRSRPIKLTPSGHILKQHALDILAHTRRMLTAVQNASDSGLSQLSIGIIDSFGDAAAEQLMARIEPFATQLSLQTGYTAPLSQAFLNRDVDMLISSDPLDDHPELERHALLRDPFLMLVSNAHCKDKRISVEELAHTLPFIRYTQSTRLGMMSDLVTRRLNIETNVRFELDSTQTLLRFVQAGHGWAISTGLCISQHPDLLKNVHVLPLANSANARYLSLLARPDELGQMPANVAHLCRTIYTEDVLPRIIQLVPWLQNHTSAITTLPII